MTDPTTGAVPRCQWCSAELPAPDLDICPSCGATLAGAAGTEDIKGVTTLDPEAILRARSEVSRPRNRLLSFITGEEPVEVPGEEEAAAIAAPDNAVRREMLRLQLEAERADLEAESVAMKTDVVLDQGIDLAALGDVPEPAPEPGGASPVEPAPATIAPAAQSAVSPQSPPGPPAPPPSSGA